MAYDWLGTFNRSQIDRFLTFARSQLPLVEERKAHLEVELYRVGTVIFRLEKGVPLGYAADPENSYLGKLLSAYEVLGGNPSMDLRVRLSNNPVFIVKGNDQASPSYTSGGEAIGARGLLDGPSAEMMRMAKEWLADTLHHRFGRLERKIRRAMDYADQLQAEIDQLTRIQQTAAIQGSLEFAASQIDQLMLDPNYRAIYNDVSQGSTDELGLNSYAPFGDYDVEKARPNEDIQRVAATPQRQHGGLVSPGESGIGSGTV